MYSGGPPVFLMWSGIFNPDKAKLKSKADLKRIRALFAAYRSEEIKILCCISLSSGLGLIPPLMVANIVDRALPNHNQAELFLFTGSMVVAALAMGLVGVYQGLQNHRMGEGIMRDLRVKLVTHLHRLPLRFSHEGSQAQHDQASEVGRRVRAGWRALLQRHEKWRRKRYQPQK